ncbi:MAG TPA: SCO family protein [Candidatus Methylomirabilis sp.]|nr:SCO family protein [Candidatus Methylomirabilis sp.]
MPRKVSFSIRSLLIAVWSGALFLGLLGAAVWTWQGVRSEWPPGEDTSLEGLQIFGTLPDFSLIERSGKRVTLADFRGKVWIADFIYTHCTDTCPLQSAELARLQADLATEPDVRLASITVDPAEDTPEVLAEYAARFGADRERWLFLTGPKRAIYTLAQKGFLLNVEDPGDAVPSLPVAQPPSARRGPRPEPASAPQIPPGRIAGSSVIEALASLIEATPVMAHPGHLGPTFLHSPWFVLVDGQARIRGYYRSEDGKAMYRLRRDVRILLGRKT